MGKDGGSAMPCAELPVEIVAKILARLPVATVFQSRLVCKAWRGVIHDPSFVQERRKELRGARPGQEEGGSGTGAACEDESWLLVMGRGLSGEQQACLYDPAQAAWHRIELGRWLHEGVRWSQSAVGGVVGGVVCSQPGSISLVNPLTGARYDLPRPPAPISTVRGVLADEGTGHFKLIGVCSRAGVEGSGEGEGSEEEEEDGKGSEFWVFDSSRPGRWWRRIEAPSPVMSLREGPGVPAAMWAGGLCWLCEELEQLVFHDLGEEDWLPLPVQWPGQFEDSLFHRVAHSLQSIDGRLFCLVLFGSLIAGMVSLLIWEFKETWMTWVLVERMPEQMFRQLLPDRQAMKGEPAFLLWWDELWFCCLEFVASGYCLHIFSRSLGVACDLSQQPPVWKWLPPCPHDFQRSYVLRVDPWLKFPDPVPSPSMAVPVEKSIPCSISLHGSSSREVEE